MDKFVIKILTPGAFSDLMSILRELSRVPTGATFYFNCTPNMYALFQKMLRIDLRFQSSASAGPHKSLLESYRFQGSNVVLFDSLDPEGVEAHIVWEGKVILRLIQE